MTNKKERSVFLLMALNAAIFVLVYALVSSNYRLAADDFHYLIKTKELGVWDAMLFYYHNWNPRWSATLITNSVLGANSISNNLFLFLLSSLALGAIAFWSFTNSVVSKLELEFTKLQSAIISFYLLGGLFYASFSKDDTWFWITVNPMYLWGSFAAILGGSLIVQDWWKPLRLLLTAALFVYVGGASETVAIASLVTLFFLGFITKGTNYLLAVDRTALHIATIACLVGFGIDLIGAGSQIRYQHLPHYSTGDKLLVGLWNYAKFALIEIPLIIPATIICASPFAFLGRKQLRFQLVALRELVLTNRKLWALADLMVIILAFALAFSMGEMGPKRAWIPLSILTLFVTIVFTYQLGTWLYIKLNGKLFQFVITIQLAVMLYQVVIGANQMMVTNKYAAKVDSRMEYISSLNTTDSVITLEPLPDSGWLFSSEISSDTSYFTNKHLGHYFNNQYQFVKGESVSSHQ